MMVSVAQPLPEQVCVPSANTATSSPEVQLLSMTFFSSAKLAALCVAAPAKVAHRQSNSVRLLHGEAVMLNIFLGLAVVYVALAVPSEVGRLEVKRSEVAMIDMTFLMTKSVSFMKSINVKLVARPAGKGTELRLFLFGI